MKRVVRVKTGLLCVTLLPTPEDAGVTGTLEALLANELPKLFELLWVLPNRFPTPLALRFVLLFDPNKLVEGAF